MKRLSLVAVAAGLALTAPLAAAQAGADKPAARKPTTKAAASPSRKELERASQTKGLALAIETIEAITDAISEAQIEIAARVMVGQADCEFNQNVSVQPIDGKPAHFRVAFKGAQYTMVPQETTTGAVRLEDKRAGIMWLQIPRKSMLMNSRIGQRMVDACTMAEQRAPAQVVPEPLDIEPRNTVPDQPV